MTHLAQFNFSMQIVMYLLAFLIVVISARALGYKYWRQMRKRRDIKFWCFTMLVIQIIVFEMYAITAWVQSYYLNPVTGLGLASNTTTQNVRYFCDALSDVGYSLVSCLIFLICAYWSTLFSDNLSAKFVSKWEFKLFITFSLLSTAFYPVTQWTITGTIGGEEYATAIPQIIFAAEMFLACGVLILVMLRMVHHIDLFRNAPNAKHTYRLFLTIQKLGWMLVVDTLLMAISHLLINAVYLSRDTIEEVHDVMTLAIWDLFSAVMKFSVFTFFLIMVLTLNISRVAKVLAVPKSSSISKDSKDSKESKSKTKSDGSKTLSSSSE